MTTDVSLEPVEQVQVHEKKKRGFTLTEIAIVLGIIGLILGAIWVAAAAVYNNLRVAHANTEVLQIAQAVRTLYATSATITAGDITSALITAGAVPSDLVNGTGAIDPWAGGATHIFGDTDNAGFSITLSSVPQAACIGLLTAVAGQSRDASLFAANVTSSAAQIATTGSPLTNAVTPTNAATACASATSNTVQFGFGLK